MSQELIGKDKFKKLSELITELVKLKDQFTGSLPVIITDEKNCMHKIGSIKVEWEDVNIPQIPQPEFIIIETTNIRFVREGKVDIALNRNEGDLTKYQEAVKKAVKCDNAEAVEILEELNAQDYLVLSGEDWRKFAEAFNQKDADLKTLQEAYREKCEIED